MRNVLCAVAAFIELLALTPAQHGRAIARQREAEEVFDLSERQDHPVRVSTLQELTAPYICPASRVLPGQAWRRYADIWSSRQRMTTRSTAA
jgi:hypothetical protein